MSGIFFALGTALFWAVATRLFRQMALYWTPVGLATLKSVVAVALFLTWFALQGVRFWEHELETVLWLFGSGIVGIAIGDSALFYALYRMGERNTLLVAETAAPVLAVSFAFLLLAESISLQQILGVALVIIGVDAVIGLRRGSKQFDKVGVLWALLAAACQASGVLVSRVFLTQTDISAEESALWRLLGATVVLPLWMWLRNDSLVPARSLGPAVWCRVTAAIFIGTFLGVLFLQSAVQRLPAGVAQALIATSIIFATAIGVAYGERVDRRQWLGVALAVAGVAVVVL
ncbi:MAG: DMT family transporter [Pseudomonadales bacterium]|nr:DMT family transporter [Halioglobus sp.]MCP5130484.1 DMT family transporter [Pseudomonadales bacterium]